MGKLEELQRQAGANSLESMGRGMGDAATEAGPTAIPARLHGITKSRDAAVIPVDRIVPDPDQPRVEFDPEALQRLADSLKTRGQLQPIRVRWNETMGRYVVVVGERRWRAAQIAGIGSLTCIITSGTPTPEELLEDQLVENCLREDLRPVEQAKAYQLLLSRLGLTQRALAERLSVSQSQIAQALALLTLPEPIRESIESGAIPPTVGYELAKVGDPDEQAALAQEARSGRLKRGEIQERTRTPRKGRGASKGKPRKVTERVLRTEAGPRVTVEFRKGLDDELVLAALREAARQVEARLATDDQQAA